MKKISYLLPLGLSAGMLLASCSFFDNFKPQESSSSSLPSSSSYSSEEERPRPKEYYRATFYDYTGNTVLYETEVVAGGTVTYQGETPTKPGYDKRFYTFEKWDKELRIGKANVEFFPVFKESLKQHTVRFLINDRVVSSVDYAYGESVSPVNPDSVYIPQGKSFAGWDKDLSALKVSGPIDIHAKLIESSNGLYFSHESFADEELGINIQGYSVVGYDGNEDSVRIPEYYQGEPVIKIGSWAFNYKSVKSVFLPDSVAFIDDSAFANCAGLSQIEFGKGLKVIGNNAFRDSKGLETVVLKDGVAKIGDYAFSNSGIVSIGLPSSVTSIGNQAFENCQNLSKADFSKANATLGSNIFSNCPSLTEIELYDGMEALPSYFFSGCSSLKTIGFPSRLKRLESYCLSGLNSLTQITLPDSVEVVGERCFENCQNLKKVVLSKNLTTLGSWAFNQCPNLEDIQMGDNILFFGAGIFEGTKIYEGRDGYLRDGIYYYPSVSGKSHYIFGLNTGDYNNRLTHSRLLPTTKAIADGLSFNQDTISVPASLCEDLSFLKRAKFVSLVLEDETTFQFKDGAIYQGDTYYRCVGSNITEATLLPNTKRIASSAFADRYEITKININDGLEKIDSYAFASTNIRIFEIPASVTDISLGLFGLDSNNKFLLMEQGANPTYSEQSIYGNLRNKIFENYSGENGVYDGTKYFVCNDEAIIYGYSRGSRYIELPSVINGHTVTTMTPYFEWSNSWDIRELTLPKQLQVLGENALNFNGPDVDLYTLNGLPSTIAEIGAGQNIGKGEIILPTRITKLGYNTFFGSKLGKIFIPTASLPQGFERNWNQSAKVYYYSDTPSYDGAHWHYVGSASGERVPEIYTR